MALLTEVLKNEGSLRTFCHTSILLLRVVMDCDDQPCAVRHTVMEFVISTWKSFSRPNDCFTETAEMLPVMTFAVIIINYSYCTVLHALNYLINVLCTPSA